MSEKEISHEFAALASIADLIKKDFVIKDDPWKKSSFGWIKSISAPARGKLGVHLVRAWCGAKGISVSNTGDSEADLLINDHRIEVKFSTLWKTGIYKFQQIRDQNYEYVVCLGISPFDAHCWVINKKILEKYVIGHRPQHTGSGGTDTFWLEVIPASPELWLVPCGGSLDQAYNVLLRM